MFWYVTAAALIGALVGVFLGTITRGARARRQEQRLGEQLIECQEDLKLANDPSRQPRPPAPSPPRWTGTEIAKVLGGMATLVGAVAGLYAAYSTSQVGGLHTQIADLQIKLQKADQEAQDSQSRITKVLGLTAEGWTSLKFPSNSTALPKKNQGRGLAELSLDGKHLNGKCSPKALSLTFGLVDQSPSLIHCSAGSALFRFAVPSRLLVIADSRQP